VIVRVQPGLCWIVTVGATAVSTCALDVVATAMGLFLVASETLNGISRAPALLLLVVTYVLWAAGLRVNVVANSRLLEATGTSTNIVSKAMFELVRRRSSRPAAARVAAAVGYVATEVVKELPYYGAAFGAAMFSSSVGSTDAIIFLAGTNIGAAAYEYGLGRLSGALLDRRTRLNAEG